MEEIRKRRDRGGTASMIVSSVCNEAKNSDLWASDPRIMRAFNDRFDELEASLAAVERERDEARTELAKCLSVVAVAREIHAVDLAALEELKGLGVEPSRENSWLTGQLGDALTDLDAARGAKAEGRS